MVSSNGLAVIDERDDDGFNITAELLGQFLKSSQMVIDVIYIGKKDGVIAHDDVTRRKHRGKAFNGIEDLFLAVKTRLNILSIWGNRNVENDGLINLR